MPRDDTYLLYMMLGTRRIIKSIAHITFADFLSDDEKMDSVVLQIGNIGEAANHVSPEFTKDHPEIPWHRIIGMRHRMFHGYQEIDWKKVWETATVFVPELLQLLEPLVPPEE
jgi:uncharacterized protein with HEPN domain